MKKFTLLCFIITASTFTSCIKEEAPNAEADIVAITLPGNIAIEDEINYEQPYDYKNGAYPISIEVPFGTDLTSLAPEFQLTPGATIEPKSGSTHNFGTPVHYTVTSESRQWQRNYIIDIHYPDSRDIPTEYSFENSRIQENYYEIYETADGKASFTWASGNPGFALAAQLEGITSADKYPTTIINEGYIGKCLKLETLLTGDWGSKVGKPIAAGNLFMGTFYLPNAIINSLGATRFGIPFRHKPTYLTGYYKYKAGNKFYDNGNYTDEKDKFSIYALFFERDNNTPYLDGNIPSQNYMHPNMVATALMNEDDVVESSEWKRFEIPFDYSAYNNEIDTDKLNEGKYSIAIIFSSSKDGDEFKGAPGSTLLIDEVELIYE